MNAESPTTGQRRHFSRVLFDATASLECDGRGSPCRLLDISLKGALVATLPPLSPAPGSRCALSLKLGDGEAEIRMEGHVAHLEGDRLGLRCDSIDIDSLTHLRRLVEVNIGDESVLERELSALTA